MKESNGPIERGVIEVADESEAQGLRIFGSRFADTVEKVGTEDKFDKSRLVVQDFKDKPEISTFGPTVQRAKQRLLFALCVCDPELFIMKK